MIYYLIIVFLILLSTITLTISGQNRLSILLSFIYIYLLIIFSGFRLLGSSPDDINYYYSLYSNISSFEPLYELLEYITKNLFDRNIQVLFLLSSILSMIPLGIILMKNRSLSLWILFIYCCHIFLYRDMIQIRAAISYNFSLLFFLLISEKQKTTKSAIVTYIISVGFHFSSFFSFVAVFLKKFSITYFKYLIFLFISIIIYLFDIRHLINTVVELLPSFFSDRIYTYTQENSNYVYKKGVLDLTIMKGVFFSLLFIYYKEEIKLYFKSYLFINLYCLSTIISISLNDFAVLSSRISSLFSCVEILMIPICILSKKKNKLFITAVIIFIYIMMIFLNLFLKDMLDNYQSYIFL